MDGKYRLERVIGAGGMGRVYETTHLTLDRKLAIKTIEAGRECRPEIVRRFVNEARHAGALAHVHICDVYDIGTSNSGRPYIVMPLLRGRSLAEEISRCGSLPMERSRQIAIQMLSALEATHAEGIVHRDLKPDNVFLVCSDEQRDFVKLLDFGISKILDSHGTVEVTDTGTVRGTPAYMAPEQAAGERRIDHRVDLYAVGVVLYEMLTGVRPHSGGSYNEVLASVLTKPFARPRSMNRAISPGLEQVVLRAMSRSPADRYRSAQEMRAAIDSSMEDEVPGRCSTATDTVSAAVASFRHTTGLGSLAARFGRLPLLLVAVFTVVGIAACVVLGMGKLGEHAIDSGAASASRTPSAASDPVGAPPPRFEIASDVATPPAVPVAPSSDRISSKPSLGFSVEDGRSAHKPETRNSNPSARSRVVEGPFHTKIVTDFGE